MCIRDRDNAYCRTYTGVSVWYIYTPLLKNCYTPLTPDRPYREMRWSYERKDKRCVHKKVDFLLSQNGSVRGGTLPYPAFTSGDVAKESLKNNIGLKFAFRSTDINEIKQTLAFFGIDKDDENNQKRLRDLEKMCIRDSYGRGQKDLQAGIFKSY